MPHEHTSERHRRIACVGCGCEFSIRDDDPLWSITTEVRDDGTEIVTGRFIEPTCPSCGKTSRWCPPGTTGRGTATDVTDDFGSVMHVNRIEAEVADDLVYDPDVPAFEQGVG